MPGREEWASLNLENVTTDGLLGDLLRYRDGITPYYIDQLADFIKKNHPNKLEEFNDLPYAHKELLVLLYNDRLNKVNKGNTEIDGIIYSIMQAYKVEKKNEVPQPHRAVIDLIDNLTDRWKEFL